MVGAGGNVAVVGLVKACNHDAVLVLVPSLGRDGRALSALLLLRQPWRRSVNCLLSLSGLSVRKSDIY